MSLQVTAAVYPFNPTGAGRIGPERVVFAVDGRRCECAQYLGPDVPLGWFAARRGWEPWRIFSAAEVFGPGAPRTLTTIAKQTEAAGFGFFALPLPAHA